MGRVGQRPMTCGLYMGRSARPMRRPMWFDGPARTAAHEMMCTILRLLRRPPCLCGRPRVLTGRPGPWPCVLLRQILLFWVCLGRYPPKTATFVRCVSGKSPRVYLVYNVMPCANVGSKPWYRCGCTDDTPCRLGDAGSMTFLPWFVPRTEPPVQLREVGPDRGHLLTDSCSDVHLHVCRC